MLDLVKVSIDIGERIRLCAVKGYEILTLIARPLFLTFSLRLRFGSLLDPLLPCLKLLSHLYISQLLV